MDDLKYVGMDKYLRNTLINSTVAFTAAFFMTTLIHELGHFISYFIAGSHPVLYHNYVQVSDQTLSTLTQVISALAGPVISLLQGIFFLSIVHKQINKGISNLFLFWLSLLGFVNFFGYLLMTPFSTIGDTGKVAELLQLGTSYRIIIAITGVIFLIWIILKEGKYFSCFIPEAKNLKERRKYVYCIMFFPIIMGSLLKTLFAFPVPALISIIYTATSSYVIMLSFGVVFKNPIKQTGDMHVQKKTSLSLIVLLIIMIAINRLLTMGLG